MRIPRLSRAFTLATLFALTACSSGPYQTNESSSASVSGPQTVELKNVKGKYPDVVSADLYFYLGKFSVPLEPLGQGLWRARLSPKQVQSMPPGDSGLRSYNSKVTVVSKAPDGQTDSETHDLTIDLQPA